MWTTRSPASVVTCMLGNTEVLRHKGEREQGCMQYGVHTVTEKSAIAEHQWDRYQVKCEVTRVLDRDSRPRSRQVQGKDASKKLSLTTDSTGNGGYMLPGYWIAIVKELGVGSAQAAPC